jgi:hypothetical protein
VDNPPLSELIDELSKIPVGPWKPWVGRFEHGTEVYWKNVPFAAEWVSNEITVYKDMSTGEIVGCRIENLAPRGRPFEFTQEHLDALRALPQAPDED